MSSAPHDPPRARRTQAERRRSTQGQLVAATIESLVEDGWSGTTTRSVAQRAGVSQGAQQHYFPTKRALVEAALGQILEEQTSLAAAWEVPEGLADRAAFLLDRLWEVHCLPVNLAVQELLTVARTDPDAAEGMRRLHAAAEGAAIEAARAVLPELADHPELVGWVRASIATMQGIVGLAAVTDPAHSPVWPHARTVLLRGAPR